MSKPWRPKGLSMKYWWHFNLLMKFPCTNLDLARRGDHDFLPTSTCDDKQIINHPFEKWINFQWFNTSTEKSFEKSSRKRSHIPLFYFSLLSPLLCSALLSPFLSPLLSALLSSLLPPASPFLHLLSVSLFCFDLKKYFSIAKERERLIFRIIHL